MLMNLWNVVPYLRDKPIYEVINGTSLAAYTGLTTQGD
jgi:hypothetical protein